MEKCHTYASCTLNVYPCANNPRVIKNSVGLVETELKIRITHAMKGKPLVHFIDAG